MHKHFDRIKKYHSDISEKKLNTYSRLFDIYEKINVKINLISRKDFENFYLHHILHSLSIIKFNLIPEKNLKAVVGTTTAEMISAMANKRAADYIAQSGLKNKWLYRTAEEARANGVLDPLQIMEIPKLGKHMRTD